MVRTDAVDVVGCWFCIVLTLPLIYVAVVNVERQRHCAERLKAFNYNRWITLACSILTLITFLGYWLESVVLIQTGWNLYVPFATVNLSLLSIQMIQLYTNVVQKRETTSIKNFKDGNDRKFKILIWVALSMCAVGAIVNWIGSAMGIISDSHNDTRTLFYSLWKVIDSILLAVLDKFIFETCIACHNQLTNARRMSSVSRDSITYIRIEMGFYKLAILLVFLALLSILLFVQGLIQFIRYATDSITSYQSNPIYEIVFIYFPIWYFISAICLVYCWIPKHNLTSNKPDTSEATVASQTQVTATEDDQTKNQNFIMKFISIPKI